ncbi:MAG: ribose 5-phosphate isomerase B [Parcubacteria group bacterium Gr01-1014_2]|nr:MAG: ribose 5-phosphate isomerase B [Parcubacteria group bacterium Gr01-1014_2]
MIYLATDHRGFKLKEKIKEWLAEWNYEFQDLGAFEYKKDDDYTEYAKLVAEKVSNSQNIGIIVCGSGVGADVVANKFDGVRSGLALDEDQVKLAREHDNINVLALASEHMSEEDAKKAVETFLKTPFSGKERYERRLSQIEDIEKSN